MGAIQQVLASYGAAAAAASWSGNAVDLDGSTEYLANTTNQAIGVANAWTVNVWFNLDVTTSGTIYINRPDDATDKSQIQLEYTTGGKMRLRAIDQNGNSSGYKFYITSVTFSTATDYMATLTRDGTNLKFYKDATEDTSMNKSVDNSITMTDTNRAMYIGAYNGGSAKINGRVATTYVWNTDLGSSSISALYDSGSGYLIDARESFGSYSETANLKHQYSWEDTGDIGADYVTSGGINVGTNAVNITSADIVDF